MAAGSEGTVIYSLDVEIWKLIGIASRNFTAKIIAN